MNKMQFGISGFKAASDDSMTFSCYGNVKNVRDHAYDVTVDGAFVNSINKHKAEGTMPKFFLNHDSWETPIGVWVDMKEDEKGLYLEGKFANTEKGREVYELMKIGAMDSFSIGYSIIDEKWNSAGGYNELREISIKEISAVNFACNEESRLVGIKSKMEKDEIPTKRELEKFLAEAGLSRKQSNVIASRYDDKVKSEPVDIFEQIATL